MSIVYILLTFISFCWRRNISTCQTHTRTSG